jgi:predicted nucleotidyltransferase
MFTQEIAIKTVQDFIKEFRKSGLNLRKAILFGSYAKNNQYKDPDIDLALVADEFTGVGFVDIKMFAKALRKYFHIQPKIYSTEYFLKGDPFIEEIKQTGIEISLEE